MKYIFKIITIIFYVIGDVLCRMFELLCYILRVIWYFKLVEYNFIDYTIYKYEDSSNEWDTPIGYYPNIYDYILNRNYVNNVTDE